MDIFRFRWIDVAAEVRKRIILACLHDLIRLTSAATLLSKIKIKIKLAA